MIFKKHCCKNCAFFEFFYSISPFYAARCHSKKSPHKAIFDTDYCHCFISKKDVAKSLALRQQVINEYEEVEEPKYF